ncbi:hypothetical protein QWJ34_20770 [Saccharibacillus sp. CPCC 101409]|uniref:hypothetical protein n=1 Tax=Saccharibacillus sp. CPCC 101409 TaxID=3058041 RepID=UPI0026712249|nr:hypothetical protein [Saccharibacillus sp. CPCC 101409]MDO3412209.1 hypothetical protein [Saccharibacillus sp. CPCC 101409]
MEFRYDEGHAEVLELDASPERIAAMLGLLNDRDRTYCSLSVNDGWYIQCAGTAEAMIVEVREPHVSGFRHYAIGKPVQHERKSGLFGLRKETVREADETFDAEETAALFRSFEETRALPGGYVRRDMTGDFK